VNFPQFSRDKRASKSEENPLLEATALKNLEDFPQNLFEIE
jgi:hypothetical protein